jgi:hypothetical protein
MIHHSAVRKGNPMKTCIRFALLASLVLILHEAAAQSTAFTYQGVLAANGTPVNGPAEVQFTLWDAESGGTLPLASNTPMVLSLTATNGQLTAPLDFGAAHFDGSDRWLQISLRTSLGPFITITPRQKITSTPYAIRAAYFAGVLASNQLAGAYDNAVTFGNIANVFNGTFSGGGEGLTNVNATLLDGFDSTGFWKLLGNAGSNSTNHFVGTTDRQPLEFKVEGQRALRLEPGTNAFGYGFSPNVIGGYVGNSVATGVIGATIAGGGRAGLVQRITAQHGTIGGGDRNTVNGEDGTIAGGGGNVVNAGYSFVGGGIFNTIESNNVTFNPCATISGGSGNTIQRNASSSTIGGGSANFVQADATSSTIGGGSANYVLANATHATVAGGSGNTVGGSYAAIPGGSLNSASGVYSFAAGRQAKAIHSGTFVWADSSGVDLTSERANQFRVRAAGGARFDINATHWIDFYAFIDSGFIGKLIDTSTGAYLSTGGAWVNNSDRAVKDNIRPVDGRKILEAVAALPISAWNYRNEDARARHIGPMAQDFHAAFGFGADEKHIATIDADGVALAAIKGLNEIVSEKDARITALEKSVTELKQIVARLAEKR